MSGSLFGPGSMMWRISREAVMLVGGPATLLLQLAHPLVAAGVADHSNFRDDPTARLRRTLDSMMTIVFGDEQDAREVGRRVAQVHRGIKGRSPDGELYDATDPALLLWVHSTLVDSSIRVYEACIGSLEPSELESYYEETKVVAELFEIPAETIPPTLEDLRDWMTLMIDSGRVRVTPLARELAGPVLRPLRLLPSPLVRRSAFITAALLPASIREGYDLRVSRLDSVALAVGRTASRLVVPRLPRPLRLMPAARAVGA